VLLTLRHYEQISTQNRQFHSNGASWPKISGRRGRPTNHSSSLKTRLSDLSYAIKIRTYLSSVLSQSTHLTTVRPILCRRPIPDTIGRSYTDTDTWLYNFFVLKMRFCAGYRCVQVIYVCGVYARKYSIGLKLQVCIATLLTVESGKRTTGLLVSAPILK